MIKEFETKDKKYYITEEAMKKAKAAEQTEIASWGQADATADSRYWAIEKSLNNGGIKMDTSKYNFTKDRDPLAVAKLREAAIKQIMGEDYEKVDEDIRGE